jgi:drug/metabolite transporter (DMT)-like permease
MRDNFFMMNSSHAKKSESAFFLAVFAAFTGGSTPIVAKFALTVFHPFTLISIRFLFATLFLLPFVMRTEKITLAKLKKFAPMGVVGALNPILLFIALQFTQASISPLIYAIVPSMTALYAFFFQKIKMSIEQWLGIIVGFLGVGFVVLLPLFEKGTSISALKGNVLIFAAAVAFMVYGQMSKHLQKNSFSSPIVLTFYFSLISLLLSLPFSLFELFLNGIPFGIQPQHIVSGIFIGVVGTGIFYLSYQQALKLSSELAAALFLYIQPIATAILAVTFLGEKITLPILVGGIVAVIGAKLASSKKNSPVVGQAE